MDFSTDSLQETHVSIPFPQVTPLQQRVKQSNLTEANFFVLIQGMNTQGKGCCFFFDHIMWSTRKAETSCGCWGLQESQRWTMKNHISVSIYFFLFLTWKKVWCWEISSSQTRGYTREGGWKRGFLHLFVLKSLHHGWSSPDNLPTSVLDSNKKFRWK